MSELARIKSYVSGQRHVVPIPEVGGTYYFRRPSALDIETIRSYTDLESVSRVIVGDVDITDQMAYVTQMAELEDGTRAFSFADGAELVEVMTIVSLNKLIEAANGAWDDTGSGIAAKKNLSKTTG